MEMIWILFAFFFAVTIVFVIIAFYFPEWIGITGQKALEIQKHQQETADDLENKPEN